jgi:hypothetical protein
MPQKDITFNGTMTISGSNSMLTGELMPAMTYDMTGLGSDSMLTLNGPFPFVDSDTGDTAGASGKNQGTISIDSVMGTNKATGTLSGSWSSGFGSDCTPKNGVITMSRLRECARTRRCAWRDRQSV